MKGVEEAEYALKLAEKLSPEYSEAYVERAYSKSFIVEQGRVNGSAYAEETGLRIRIIKNSRLYTISTNKLDKERIKALVSRFRSFKGLDTHMSAEKRERANYKVGEKESIDNADMLKDLLKIDKELSGIKYIKYRRLGGGVGRSMSYYLNSDGSEISSNIPIVTAIFEITLSNGKESKQGAFQFGNTGGYENFNSRKIADHLINASKSLYEVMEKGKMLSDAERRNIKNVVISPEISGIATHESIGHPSEADRVFGREAAQAGTSYITNDNLGLEIGSEQVNIIDDPTIKNSFGFYLYDDEGVKARPKKLVEKGLQSELLTNREYARILKQKSNGSARSDSYSNEPLIRMSNTYLKPGNADFDELVSEAKNGIYLKSYDSMEWNIDDTRSFAIYAGNEAYLIRNGSIDKPVKNYKLEIYTLDFWHAVKLVGKDFELYVATCGKGEPTQGVPVTTGGASALLEFG